MAGMKKLVDPIPHVNRASNVSTKDKLIVDKKMFVSIHSKGSSLKIQAWLLLLFQAKKFYQFRNQAQ